MLMHRLQSRFLVISECALLLYVAHGLNTTVKYDSKQETDHVEETEDIPELRVYTRRWYILALFCAMACHQVRIIYMNL